MCFVGLVLPLPLRPIRLGLCRRGIRRTPVSQEAYETLLSPGAAHECVSGGLPLTRPSRLAGPHDGPRFAHHRLLPHRL